MNLDAEPTTVIQAENYPSAGDLDFAFHHFERLCEIVELHEEIFNFCFLGIYMRWYDPEDPSCKRDPCLNVSNMSWKEYPENRTNATVKGSFFLLLTFS